MSWWDDLKETASNAVKNVQPDAEVHMADWLRGQLSDAFGGNQQTNEPVPQTLTPPTQVQVVTQGIMQNKMFIFIAIAAAIAAFLLLKKK